MQVHATSFGNPPLPRCSQLDIYIRPWLDHAELLSVISEGQYEYFTMLQPSKRKKFVGWSQLRKMPVQQKMCTSLES